MPLPRLKSFQWDHRWTKPRDTLYTMDLFSTVCRIAESNRGSKSSRQRGGATDRSGNAKNSQLLNQAWSKNEFTRDIKPLITLWTRVNFELVYANYKRKRIENRKRGEGEGEMYPANVSNEKKKKERKKERKKRKKGELQRLFRGKNCARNCVDNSN